MLVLCVICINALYTLCIYASEWQYSVLIIYKLSALRIKGSRKMCKRPLKQTDELPSPRLAKSLACSFDSELAEHFVEAWSVGELPASSVQRIAQLARNDQLAASKRFRADSVSASSSGVVPTEFLIIAVLHYPNLEVLVPEVDSVEIATAT